MKKYCTEENLFKERKKQRSNYYFENIYGWKLRKCTACSGSGCYDHNGSPKCGVCCGTGKERYKDLSLKVFP